MNFKFHGYQPNSFQVQQLPASIKNSSRQKKQVLQNISTSCKKIHNYIFSNTGSTQLLTFAEPTAVQTSGTIHANYGSNKHTISKEAYTANAKTARLYNQKFTPEAK